MHTLFPKIKPYHSGTLPVSTLHTLYYEECGNPLGVAALFLHGGPGGGIGPDSRRFFDPAYYRIVLFDQRGAGKSTPYAETSENDTWSLVEDIEKLRLHLGVERWVILGGSWGSTLALCYAIRHPQRVSALVLRGVYLGRRWENHWLFQEGASYFYPDQYQKYIEPIPPAERGDLISAYCKRLTDPDKAVHLAAAQTWAGWESALVRLNPKIRRKPVKPRDLLAIARFECYYIVNDMFFPSDNYILENAACIAHLPVYIIHGRFDVVCPPTNAWELHHLLPNSHLNIIQRGSHAASEAHMAGALVEATEALKGSIQPEV
jgi:proline iminopeptidase